MNLRELQIQHETEKKIKGSMSEIITVFKKQALSELSTEVALIKADAAIKINNLITTFTRTWQKKLDMVPMLKGEPGADAKIPTDDYFRELIKPLIPEVKDGKTPTDQELISLIKPLIPNVYDGHTPTDRELLALIKPLIPIVKDGSPDNGDQIIEKINISTQLIDAARIKNLPVQTKKGRAHGGGDTVLAGTGVVVTRNIDGTKTISTTGGAAPTVIAKTADYTVLATDLGNVLSMNSASTHTFTLPAFTTADIGKTITFVKLGVGKVVIQAPASTIIADSSSAGTLYNDSTTETWSNVIIQILTTTKVLIIGGDGTWFTT